MTGRTEELLEDPADEPLCDPLARVLTGRLVPAGVEEEPLEEALCDPLARVLTGALEADV